MKTTRATGFSLIEMIIVVAVLFVAMALGVPKFLTLINNYRVNSAARSIQSLATLAHVKAAARNTRYRVLATSTTYTLQYCNDAIASRTNPCNTWVLDNNPGASATLNLPVGVTFSTTGITTPAPVASSVSQATEMTFNSRGLLFDESANTPANNRCFYLRGNNTKPMAVCTILTGRTIVYSLSGTSWSQL